MLPVASRSAVSDHQQSGVVHADRVPLLTMAANEAATIGNDHCAAGTVEADARDVGKRRIAHDARNRTGDIQVHKSHVARSDTTGPVAVHVPQTISIWESKRGVPGGLRR